MKTDYEKAPVKANGIRPESLIPLVSRTYFRFLDT